MSAARVLRLFPAIAGCLALTVAGCERGDDAATEAADPQGGSGPTAAEAQAAASGGVVALEPGEAGEGGDRGAAADGPTPEIDRDTYTVRVNAPSAASRGASGIAEIHVVPKDGWKMNHDFPMRLVVAPPEGVVVEGGEQVIADAVHYSDERGEWAVSFTPEAEGEKTFEADFRFAVCTDEVCIPKREKLAWVVDVD